MNAWRKTIKENRIKRLTLMNKAWKSLKAQEIDAKQMRKYKIISIKEASIRW